MQGTVPGLPLCFCTFNCSSRTQQCMVWIKCQYWEGYHCLRGPVDAHSPANANTNWIRDLDGESKCYVPYFHPVDREGGKIFSEWPLKTCLSPLNEMTYFFFLQQQLLLFKERCIAICYKRLVVFSGCYPTHKQLWGISFSCLRRLQERLHWNKTTRVKIMWI